MFFDNSSPNFFDALFDLNRDGRLNIAERALQYHFLNTEMDAAPVYHDYDIYDDCDEDDEEDL